MCIHVCVRRKKTAYICNISNSYEWSLLKLFGGVSHGPGKNQLDFSGNPDSNSRLFS